jgi:hypothetical protein
MPRPRHGDRPASRAASRPAPRGAPIQAGPEPAPPDGMSWRVYHLMMAQLPLDAAATRIQALAARPGPAHRGFFETAVDDSRRVLTVYWHGPVPANVQRLISRLRARVDLRVVQTRYSLATIEPGRADELSTPAAAWPAGTRSPTAAAFTSACTRPAPARPRRSPRPCGRAWASRWWQRPAARRSRSTARCRKAMPRSARVRAVMTWRTSGAGT